MAVVRRRSGFKEQQRPDPELPSEIAYLWLFWNELHSARGYGGMSPNPISWPDISAFSQVADEPLEPWEARAIRAVDNRYLAGLAGATEEDG